MRILVIGGTVFLGRAVVEAALARRRAMAAGLRIGPLADTIADTWAWLRDGGELSGWRDELRGEPLEAARERALLAELMS